MKDTDAVLGEVLPRKQLAGIHFACRCDIGVADHTVGWNGMPREDAQREFDQTFDLEAREMTNNQTHAPGLTSSMPIERLCHTSRSPAHQETPACRASQTLIDMAINAAIAIDGIMAEENFRFRIAQPLQRFLGAAHPGIMQHQNIDRAAFAARIVVRRRTFDPAAHEFPATPFFDDLCIERR